MCLTVPLAVRCSHKNKNPLKISGLSLLNGGERGIRTPDTLLTYTRFPSERDRPLCHLSVIADLSVSIA